MQPVYMRGSLRARCSNPIDSITDIFAVAIDDFALYKVENVKYIINSQKILLTRRP